MANYRIKRYNHPGPSNSLTPRIQNEPQRLWPLISKATHAFLNRPSGLNMRPIRRLLQGGGGRPAFTASAAVAMALALRGLAPTATAATETTLYTFPQSGQAGYYPT